MLKRFVVLLTCVATPGLADIDDVLTDHIAPGYSTLVEATAHLSNVAEETCAPEAITPAFHTAYDAWIRISHIQFGPLEDQGLALAMSFWPDPKDSTGKAIARLTRFADPIVNAPDQFGEVSAAAQGFTALERLLYDPQPDAEYACKFVRAVAEGLSRKAMALESAWPAFADRMTTAGASGNARFQSDEEVNRALYTALSTGLEFLHDQRLGRPLGSFERPRPRRAEARRSERSLRHIVLTLNALEDLTTTFFDGDLSETKAAFAAAKERAASLDDPALAGVANPVERIRVEALQRTVNDIRNAVNEEIGKPLGITAGFNSLDGD
ncbi:MAG: imelysin family protein [Pseudomonadota bacterium]